MTEELVIEAEEWLNKWELCNKCNHKVDCIEEHSYCHLVVNRAYLAAAEPREKRIAELEMTVGTLRNLSNEQATCIEKLESQIEKMRNCANCKNYNDNEGFCVLGSGYGYNCNLEKWEIKEND